MGQLPQFAAELSLPDALIEVGGVALEQVGDVGAGGLAVVAEGDDLEDPAQGEADRRAARTNPRRPMADRVVVIDAGRVRRASTLSLRASTRPKEQLGVVRQACDDFESAM